MPFSFFLKNLLNSGIATEIYSLINNEEVRPTANLVISKSTAYEYLNNSKPNLEKLTTQYYETFSITGRFTGYFSNISIGDFYNDLSATCHHPTAILGGLNSTARKEDSEKSTQGSGQGSSDSGSSSGSDSGSSDSSGSSSGSGNSGNSGTSSSGNSQTSDTSNNKNSDKISESPNVITNPENLTAGTSSIVGQRGTENFGIAVFNDDKLCGELTAVESICHLLIQNKIDSCIISIDNPLPEKETEKMELQLFPKQNSKINITLDDDTPHIYLDINLNADIMTLDKDVEYETDEIFSKISNTAKDYLTNQFNNYLKKISTEYESDIDHFCTKATSNFFTISDWENFNWNEKFKNSKFDVNIDINVLSTMLVTKT